MKHRIRHFIFCSILISCTPANRSFDETDSTTTTSDTTTSGTTTSDSSSNTFSTDETTTSTSTTDTSSSSESSGSGGTSSTDSSGTSSSTSTHDLYVDPVNGNDNNSGELTAPLKTLKTAMILFELGQTIYLMEGTYDASTGETFSVTIPKGVDIRTYNNATAILVGTDSQTAFSLNGSATIDGITLQGFNVAFAVYADEVDIANVSISDTNYGIETFNTSKTSIEDSSIDGAFQGAYIEDASQLSLTNVSITDIGPNCSVGATAVYATDNATLQIISSSLHNNFSPALELHQYSETDIIDTTFQYNGTDSCPEGQGTGAAIQLTEAASLSIQGSVVELGRGAGILALDTNTIDIQSSTFQSNETIALYLGSGNAVIYTSDFIANSDAGIVIDGGDLTISLSEVESNTGTGIYLTENSSITMRDCSIQSNVGPGIDLDGSTGSADLGTEADPGGNIIQNNVYEGLFVTYSQSVTIYASQNTWVPNEQGADSTGHFAVGTSLAGPIDSDSPKNFRVMNSGPIIQF